MAWEEMRNRMPDQQQKMTPIFIKMHARSLLAMVISLIVAFASFTWIYSYQPLMLADKLDEFENKCLTNTLASAELRKENVGLQIVVADLNRTLGEMCKENEGLKAELAEKNENLQEVNAENVGMKKELTKIKTDLGIIKFTKVLAILAPICALISILSIAPKDLEFDIIGGLFFIPVGLSALFSILLSLFWAAMDV